MLIFFAILVVVAVVLIVTTITGNVTEENSPEQMSEEGKKNDKEEKKEREWADTNEQVKFVVHGGKVQCPFCSPPMADIIVTSSTIMMQDKPWASIKDKDGKVNFNFTGVCKHPSQQKPSAPPPPCKSVISLGEWQNYSDTMVGDNNALLVKSTIPCNISGQDLKIIDSGQIAVLEDVKPKTKREPKVLKIRWLNEDMTEEITSLYAEDTVILEVKTKDYNEGDKVEVKLNNKSGHDVIKGKKEIILSGIVESDGFARIKTIFKNEDIPDYDEGLSS